LAGRRRRPERRRTQDSALLMSKPPGGSKPWRQPLKLSGKLRPRLHRALMATELRRLGRTGRWLDRRRRCRTADADSRHKFLVPALGLALSALPHAEEKADETGEEPNEERPAATCRADEYSSHKTEAASGQCSGGASHEERQDSRETEKHEGEPRRRFYEPGQGFQQPDPSIHSILPIRAENVQEGFIS